MQGISADQRRAKSRRRNSGDGERALARSRDRMGGELKTEIFCLSGEEKKEPFAYTTCGLENIFLLNGYEVLAKDGEEYVFIMDIEDLHRAIGRHLVKHRKGLAPKEIKFLRKTMDLTQAELASKLGNDSQSVARWEKGVCEMPGTAEKLFRALFMANNLTDEKEDLVALRKLLTSVLSELDQFDEGKPAQAKFEFNATWDEVERKAA